MEGLSEPVLVACGDSRSGNELPDPPEQLVQMEYVSKGQTPDPGWEWLVPWFQKDPRGFGEKMVLLGVEYQKTLQVWRQERLPVSLKPEGPTGHEQIQETIDGILGRWPQERVEQLRQRFDTSGK